MNQKRFKKLMMLLVLVPLMWIVTACSPAGNESTAPEETTDSAAEETTTETEEAATEESEDEATEPSGESIQLTDSIGREVTLDRPVETVVAEQPSHAEILYALGEEDALVGRGSYVDYPEEVSEVPDVGSGQDINYEAIIQLDPDVVFMGQMGDPDEEFSQLEDAGITVMVVHAETLDEVYETIDLIGSVMGAEDAADNVVADMQSTFEEYGAMADEQVTEGEEPSVYFEISPLEFGLWTAGTETFMHEIAEILNMDNVFADIQGFGEVSEEQVLDRDPEYIITTSMETEDFDPVEEILNRPGWENITAVQNGNVFTANSDEFTRPGPRLTDAVESLYNFIYGEESMMEDAA